jgi:hypothetical protein
LCSFSCRGFARGNDADRAAANCVGDGEHTSVGIHTKRHVTFLAGVVVDQSYRAIIVKYDHRIDKLDSMFAPVRFRLLRILFKLHFSPPVYIVHVLGGFV